jgi:orotidine-5'-phosphate decarboxylase
MIILVPGIGAQGGDLESTMEAGLNSKKRGMIISSSRHIIFSDDPRKEATKLRDAINSFR